MAQSFAPRLASVGQQQQPGQGHIQGQEKQSHSPLKAQAHGGATLSAHDHEITTMLATMGISPSLLTDMLTKAQ